MAIVVTALPCSCATQPAPYSQEDFDVVGEIAKGSFGVVYKAIRKGTEALTAAVTLLFCEGHAQLACTSRAPERRLHRPYSRIKLHF